MMKRIFLLLLATALLLSAIAVPALAEGQAVRVASLKGPTSIGLVKLMQDAEAGVTAVDYTFAVEGTADAITPALVKGELDIALVPANLASVLYNNANGAVQIAAITTLGVLYVVENGDSIASVQDLTGKTIYSTGMGTTPEFALNTILAGNGMDPEKDVNIEYRSEATEVLSAVLADQAAIAVLPQPYVTAALMQNEGLRVVLSFSDEWDKLGNGSALVTGVAVVNAAFAQANPGLVDQFLADCAASAEYVNANPAEAGAWVAELGIVAKAAIAEKAIPACNIVCITGADMKTKTMGYLEALYALKPEAVGGALPDDGIFYEAANP